MFVVIAAPLVITVSNHHTSSVTILKHNQTLPRTSHRCQCPPRSHPVVRVLVDTIGHSVASVLIGLNDINTIGLIVACGYTVSIGRTVRRVLIVRIPVACVGRMVLGIVAIAALAQCVQCPQFILTVRWQCG